MIYQDNKSFLEALNNNNLKMPISSTGLVKKSLEDSNIVLFLPIQNCTGDWIKIPAEMIATAEVIGQAPLDNHLYPIVKLAFKNPVKKNQEAAIFAELLGFGGLSNEGLGTGEKRVICGYFRYPCRTNSDGSIEYCEKLICIDEDVFNGTRSN